MNRTGNYIQDLVITYNGKESERERERERERDIDIVESLCYMTETNTAL